ncbi:MAG: hypothetical protein WAL91_07680, partial [Propionicimonas sp.]
MKSSLLTVAISTLPKPPEPPKEPADKPADKPADQPEKPPEPKPLVSVAIDPVIAMNKVATSTQALIKDSPVVTGTPSIVAGGSLTVAAGDTATITSTVSAPAIAVAVDAGTNPSKDKGAIAVTVAISVSRNDIRTATDAAIMNVPSVRAGGVITVSASEAASIHATSTAAAVSVSASTTGQATSFSGGGATAVNLIAGHTIAKIADTGLVQTTGGSIAITATNSSAIAATIAAVSAALSLSLKSDKMTAGVAIGVSIARNLIGWYEWAGANPIAVKAQAVDTSLKAATGITISAASTAVIDAFVLAASVAIAASTTDAVAVSIGGLWTDNRIATAIEASAERTSIDAGAGAVLVTASDSSKVTADAMAAAVTASLSGGKSGAGSVGVALAHNTVDNTITAFIANAATMRAGGKVTVTASNDSEIRVKSIAVAVSAAVSTGAAAIALAGGGAESTNVVLSTAKAYLQGGSLGTSGAQVGDVTISATSTGLVEALVLGVAAAISFSGSSPAPAFALGVAVARNFIGWDPDRDLAYDYLSTDSPAAVLPGDVVKLARPAGDAYIYLGTNPILPAAGRTTVPLDTLDYSNRSLWAPVGVDHVSTDRPDQLVTGDLVLITDGARAGDVYEYLGPTLDEPAYDYDATHTTTVTGGIAYGTRVKALNGNVYRWVPSFNQYTTDVVSWLPNNSIVFDAGTGRFYQRTGGIIGPALGEVSVDLSTQCYSCSGWILVNPTNLSVAGTNDGNWILLNGVELATLDYADTTVWKQSGLDLDQAKVLAAISGADVYSSGAISITASSSQSIDATVFAGAAAISGGGTTGVVASGAGAFAQNRIATDVQALIDGTHADTAVIRA